jgi:hypothetical protein
MIPLLLIAAAIALLATAVLAGRRPTPPPAPPVRPVPARRIRTDVPHLLYRYVWLVGGDCYYGISNEPEKRHARELVDPRCQWWIRQSTKVMIPVRWYPDRDSAHAAEVQAIESAARRGAYLANYHHNPRRRTRAVAR